jgi:Flp pilus assembly CpaE family ATPase
MARDAQEAAEKLYEKDFDKELKAHFKNQVHKVTYHERPRRKKKRGIGFALSR